MHVLFINTGVQLVCEPYKSREKTNVGLGWQRCEFLGSGDKVETHPFIQWQLLRDRIVFAVDTTCGDDQKGYFRPLRAHSGDFVVSLTRLVDRDKKVVPNCPNVQIVLHAASADGGEPKPVDLIVDFGNSRTGALLVEEQTTGPMPQMVPFELANRFQLNLWDATGRYERRWSARWFSSRTQWCQSPYLPPPRLKKKVYRQEIVHDIFGRERVVTREEEVEVTPRLFQDISPVRMGQEADDVTQAMGADADARTGLSSPKRYLWAADASWLGGALWNMADPTNSAVKPTGVSAREYSAPLQGPFFRFLPDTRNDDDLHLPPSDCRPDSPPNSDEVPEADLPGELPHCPQHPPRMMMVAALYEILCQAYGYINSQGYRELVGDKKRQRKLRTLALTFPSGMIAQERARFKKQARKAIELFHATLGRTQEKPALMMQIDEASAVHLTYIWSELQMLERNAALWFSLVGRARPGVAAGRQPEEVRIGCIDIGGGTSDLMIARYSLRAVTLDEVRGEMLHRDGISVAGDQLLKRLIERIIVPRLAECAGMTAADVAFLFGQEVPANTPYRSQRLHWMNRMFVPLAQAYLQVAVNNDRETVLSHTNPDYVDPEIVDSLERVIDNQQGAGNINVKQDLALVFKPDLFDDIVHEVFNDLLIDFCQRLVNYDVDIILLAGLPTKLRPIQDLVKQYVPLHSSRVIPVHNHYAGNWYPYQDDKGRNPGLIVDPKSAVVVGGAIDLVLREGRLGQFKFSISGIDTQDPTHDNDYFWGLLTEGTSKIQKQRVLFQPPEPGKRGQAVERYKLEMVTERVLIGRRLSANEQAEASPVWSINVDKRGRSGPIDLEITLERKRATKAKARGNARDEDAHQDEDDDGAETLKIVDVKGTVAGIDACADEGPDCNVKLSWRTLTTDAFYLDTGALDNIQLTPRG